MAANSIELTVLHLYMKQKVSNQMLTIVIMGTVLKAAAVYINDKALIFTSILLEGNFLLFFF